MAILVRLTGRGFPARRFNKEEKEICKNFLRSKIVKRSEAQTSSNQAF